MKRISSFLSMFIILTLCHSGFAESFSPKDHTFDDYQYILLDDGTAEIVRYWGEDSKLIIPEALENHTVTSIGDWAFARCTSLINITVPNSVIKIGKYAFYACINLLDISLSQNIVSIGDHAFRQCVSLLSFTIPKNVSKIEAETFAVCSSLYDISIHKNVTSIGEKAFLGCESLVSFVIPDGVQCIGNEAFRKCLSLTTVIIPENVKEIGINPFSSCYNLLNIQVSTKHPYLEVIDGVLFSKSDKRLICYPCAFNDTYYKIPDKTEIIGEKSFYECDILNKIEIPESVFSIENEAFCQCSSLFEINIPKNVTKIGINPFELCEMLYSINLSSTQYFEILNGALISKLDKTLICYPCASRTKQIIVPDGIIKIGDYAFYHCDSLAYITFPNSMTYIGNYAFMYCSELTAINIPTNITVIGNSAFSQCKKLISVTVPEGLTQIGDYSFNSCSELKSINLPQSVAIIGEGAFAWCNKLTISVVSGSFAEEYCIANAINHFSQKSFPIVTFGHYLQGANRRNGIQPIEWMILDIQDEKCLLLSKYSLDIMPYNTGIDKATWEKSSLRKWLNNEFFLSAFSSAEQSAILSTTVSNSDLHSHHKIAEKNTQDQVFLLSYYEAVKLYFSNDAERICMPTEYAISKGAIADQNNHVSWWLRSPGQSLYEADCVWVDGDTTYYGAQTFDKKCVRPALWLDLSSKTQFDGKDQIVKTINSILKENK